MSSTTAAAVEGTAESLAGFGQVDNTMSSTIAASTNKEATSITGSLITSTLGNFVESSLKAIISSTTAAPTAAINPTTATTSSSSTSTSIRAETTFTMPTSTTTFSSMLTSGHATESSTTKAATMQNVADLSSSLQHFGIIDYLVFVLMLIVCAVIGFYFGFVEKKKKKKRNIEQRRGSEALDYLVGGRKMKVFPVSLSLVASFVSGISLLGTSTEIYVYGTQYAFILLTLAISGVISWYVFLPVFCNLQLTSTYEYLERRFDRRIRLFGSLLFIILVVLWMPISIYVPALTFNQVTGFSIYTITPMICIICTFYTCVGGIKGVVWTDVLQSFIMVGSLMVVIIKGTIDVGGLGVVLQRNIDSGRLAAPDMTIDPTVRMSFLAVIVGGIVLKLQGSAISQPAVQRFLSLPNMKAVKKSLIIFTFGFISLLALCMYLGLLAFAAYWDCDPITTKLARAKDQVIPLYVMQIAGVLPGVPGLFVSGVFSAALSSLSTGLNSLSGVILKDFIEPYRAEPLTERQTAIALRLVVVIFGLAAMFMVRLVEKLGMVMQLSATVGSMSAGPLLGIFTIGMLFPFVNTKSVLTGCSIGASVMGYIGVRAQIAIARGELKFPIKPVSVDGCTYEYEAELSYNSTITDAPVSSDTIPPFHHISFLWYGFVGATTTIIVSLLATLCFGCQDTSELDPQLVVPFVRRFMKPQRYDSLELVSNQKRKQSDKNVKWSNPNREHDEDKANLASECLVYDNDYKLRKLSLSIS